MIDEKEVDFDHIWNLKCFIYYRHEGKDFKRIMSFINGVDYVLLQYYFDDEERYINITKQR